MEKCPKCGQETLQWAGQSGAAMAGQPIPTEAEHAVCLSCYSEFNRIPGEPEWVFSNTFKTLQVDEMYEGLAPRDEPSSTRYVQVRLDWHVGQLRAGPSLTLTHLSMSEGLVEVYYRFAPSIHSLPEPRLNDTGTIAWFDYVPSFSLADDLGTYYDFIDGGFGETGGSARFDPEPPASASQIEIEVYDAPVQYKELELLGRKIFSLADKRDLGPDPFGSPR